MNGLRKRLIQTVLLLAPAFAWGSAQVACTTTYAGGLTTPFTVYAINTATGAPLAASAATPRFNAPYATVAMARDPVTNRLYFIENTTTASSRIGYYDFATGTVVDAGTINKSGGDTGNFTRFGFNASGVGYASISTNNAVYTITPATATSVTPVRLGTLTGINTGLSGDFAMTAANRAWLSANGVVYRIRFDTLVATQIVDTGSTAANGVAFDTNSDLLVSDQTSVSRVNLGTLTVSPVGPMTGQPNTSADLANCVIPTLEPVVSATKTVSPTGSVLPGSTLTYTVTVTNTGNRAASNTVFTDAVPANTTYVANSTTLNGTAVADVGGAMPYAAGGTIKSAGTAYSAGTLATGSTNAATITFQVRVNNPFPSTAAQISNQGTVTHDSGTDTTVSVPTDSDTNTAGTQATISAVTGRDFGDAPDTGTGTAAGNYLTLGSDNGPSHTLVTGLSLGSVAPDADAGTLQNAAATADDGNATADEDGVASFPTLLTTSGQTYTVAVNATNSTGANAFLVGYIDFNKDGDFLDANEKSATVTVASSAINPRSSNVTFTTPTGMTVGQSYARFRLSSTQAQAEASFGAAASGEVEDYALGIFSSVADVAVSKVGPASVVRGSSVVYTLKVWNRGTAVATGVTVTDILSADLQGAEWACVASGTAQCTAGAATASGTGNLSLTTGALPVNASATAPTTGSYLTITVRAALNKSSTTTSLPNTATVAAPSGTADTDAANNSSSVSTTVTDPAPNACIVGSGSVGGTNLFTAAGNGTFGDRAAGDNAYGSPAADPYGGTFINTGLYAYDQTDGAVAQNRYSLTSTSGIVAGTPGFWNGAHSNILDYDNPGTGRFMYVDASATRGYFFRQQVTGLNPNTNYLVRFVAMNANLGDSTDPILALQVNGVEYYSSGTIPETATPTWREFSFVFNTGSNTAPLLEIVNDQPTVTGNDLAIDSIRLTTCAGYPTGSVGGTVYSDDDRADDLDAAEPRVAGAQVSLLVGTTVVATTTTDAAGNYSFGNLTLATYSVRLDTFPAGYTVGTTNPLAVTLTTTTPGAPGTNFGLDNEPPTTDDRTAPSMPNSSGDTALTPALSGADTGSVTGFRVTALPAAASGVLRWDDDANAATPPVAVAQGTFIPVAQAGSLYFDPDPAFVGNATFSYAAVDNAGAQDATPATYTVPVTGTPDLTLTKTHAGSFTVGQTGTYSVTVGNAGTAASSGTVTVTDTLPTGLTFVAGSTTGTGWTCSAAGQTVTCTSTTTVAAAGSSTFTFNVNVGTGTAPGTNSVTNTASVSGGGDVNPANNGASDPTTVLSSNLTITKTHTGTFTRGSTGSYTLTVGNTGTAATSGTITVVDTLPTGLTFVAGSVGGTNAANWTCSSSGQTLTCTSAAAIATGGSSVFTFTVDVAATTAAAVTNTASVSGGNEATANNTNNSASDPTNTVGTPNLSVDKAHSGTFVRGSSGLYTFVVSNSGSVATSGTVTLTDTLPAAFTVNGGAAGTVMTGGANGANWTCSSNAASPQTVTCTSTTAITAGGSSTLTLNVNVGATAPATVTNTAAVAGGGELAADAGNNSDADPTTTVSAADLTLTKSHSGSFTVGGTGTYTLNVANGGETSSSGLITVTDTLPVGLTVNGGAAGSVTTGGTNGADWSCSSNAASPQVVTCTSGTVIAAGGSSVFSFGVGVGTGTAPGTNSVTNTASVAGGGDSVTSNNTASDPTTVFSPDLTLSKTHSPSSFVRGSTGSYTVTVGNAGTAATNGAITVTDTLPAGLSVPAGSVATGGTNGANWTCSASGQTLTCTSTTAIPVSGSSVFSFSVNVAAGAGSSVTNSVAVAGGSEATANNGNNVATDPTPTVTPPDLTLAKSHTGSFAVGGTGTYSFTVTNGGGSASSGPITVTDTLPAGLTFVAGSTTGAGWTCSAAGQTVTCTSSTVISVTTGSNTSTFGFSVNVGTGTALPTVTNTASVVGGGDTTSSSSNGDVTTVVSADLTLGKTHTPGTFVRGGTGTYTLTVGNAGTAATSGTITVTDTLPTGLTVPAGSVTLSGTNAAAWSCAAAGQTITCTSTAALAVSGSSTFSFAVGVAANAPLPSVTNTATVANPNEATANTGNNTASDVTPTATPTDLALSKTHTGSFTVGGTGTYSLTVTNGGGTASSGTVTVTDTLPTGLTFVAGSVGGANGANWTCSASGQTLTCTSATAIATGGSSTFTFNVNVGVGTAPGTNSVTNTASVSGGGDANPANNGASDPTTVLSPDLTLTKTHTPTSFIRGGTGSYTITVSNSGTASTSGQLTVTDTLPAGLSVPPSPPNLTLSGTNAANWACAANNATPQTITCTSTAAIATSSSSTFTFTVSVAASAAPSVTNEARVSGGNEATANVTPYSAATPSNTARDVTPTVDAGTLTLSKTVRNVTRLGPTGVTSSGEPGDVLEYCIGYTNPGGSTVTNTVLSDTVPANTLALLVPYAGNAVQWTVTAPTGGVQTLSAGADADAGELGTLLTVRLGTIPPAGAGNVCFRVTIN